VTGPDPISVTFVPEWRRATWGADVPSRRAWFVTCTEHPYLGRDYDGEPWGYATSGRAWGVATRHRRTTHGVHR
jgi:hypothetical protein